MKKYTLYRISAIFQYCDQKVFLKDLTRQQFHLSFWVIYSYLNHGFPPGLELGGIGDFFKHAGKASDKDGWSIWWGDFILIAHLYEWIQFNFSNQATV